LNLIFKGAIRPALLPNAQLTRGALSVGFFLRASVPP